MFGVLLEHYIFVTLKCFVVCTARKRVSRSFVRPRNILGNIVRGGLNNSDNK